MLGPGVNDTPLLARPPTVTTTFPGVAPIGTGTPICVSLQLLGVAGVPLKVTALEPCVEPKCEPVIPSSAPTDSELLSMLLIFGGVTKVNDTVLLFWKPALTCTFPVMAPVGTGATICVSLQLVGVAPIGPDDPWKVMLPPFCVAPKLLPVTVTEVPT
jgi:hypothetical protein